MPTYEYECRRCGRRVERLRKIAERNDPVRCGCGSRARFVISAPAGWVEKDRWKQVVRDIRRKA